MAYKKNVIGVNGSSDYFLVHGECDLLILGLTSGSVKVQALLPGEAALVDLPGLSYTTDSFETIYVSEDQVKLRFTGVGNNADVTVRFGRK